MSVPQTPGLYWARLVEDRLQDGPWTLLVRVKGRAPFLTAYPFPISDQIAFSIRSDQPMDASRLVFGPRIPDPDSPLADSGRVDQAAPGRDCRHVADLERIVAGELIGEGALEVLRGAIAQERAMRDQRMVYACLIADAEMRLVYGPAGRPGKEQVIRA